jgi:hypothetical protein
MKSCSVGIRLSALLQEMFPTSLNFRLVAKIDKAACSYHQHSWTTRPPTTRYRPAMSSSGHDAKDVQEDQWDYRDAAAIRCDARIAVVLIRRITVGDESSTLRSAEKDKRQTLNCTCMKMQVPSENTKLAPGLLQSGAPSLSKCCDSMLQSVILQFFQRRRGNSLKKAVLFSIDVCSKYSSMFNLHLLLCRRK